MDINLVQEELMKRYLYLYENRELVLSLCINFGIRKDYYNKQIKDNNELIEILKNQKLDDNKDLYDDGISNLLLINSLAKRNLIEPQVYLFAKVSDEIVDAYEEFLFTDKDIENTDLYRHVESLKNNSIFLESVQDLIDKLEERRQKNLHLKRIPTFTVWKILTYVRNKNKDNEAVLEALDRYYNIDRYFLTGIDWDSGYKLLQSDYKYREKMSKIPNSRLMAESNFGGQYSSVISDYSGNEFEKEDDYAAFDFSIEFENKFLNNYSKTNFMKALSSMPMLSCELKRELYQKVKPVIKNKIRK